MYYDYPETELAYSQKNQYMFGDNLLVAPVLAPHDNATGLSEVSVWLPQGEWYEMATGATLNGGEQVQQRSFTLNEIPYYAKSGSIIPMNHASVRNLQTPCDTLSLFVVPGDAGTLNYYEDDGVTNAYADKFTQTKITKTTNASGEEVIITIAPRKGSYGNMPAGKAYELLLPLSFPPAAVEINGKPISRAEDEQAGAWTYDGYGLTTKILTKKLPCSNETVIKLRFTKEQIAQKDLLNGKVKLFQRFAAASELYRTLSRNLPEDYFAVAQIPAKITANPEKTVEYLQFFEANLGKAMEMVEQKGTKHPVTAVQIQRQFEP
jgi:hypothetical protein